LTQKKVRLMQTASGCIVSGSAVTALLNNCRSFKPNDLDFYTPFGSGTDVVCYILLSGKYLEVDLKNALPGVGEYNFAAGIGRVWTLRLRHSTITINVIESLTLNPFDAVCHFHSTCVFGAWTASGIWHGYPLLTLQGRSLTTPMQLPLGNDLRTHQHIWNILRKYRHRGFSFVLGELEEDHVCGEHYSCPATTRTTDDPGCLWIPFPPWLYDDESPPVYETSWSLGGTGCRSGLRQASRSHVMPRPARGFVGESSFFPIGIWILTDFRGSVETCSGGLRSKSLHASGCFRV
ncbi:hypothetical protein C8R43DRAFT_882488, partial [Mycena crocata]